MMMMMMMMIMMMMNCFSRMVDRRKALRFISSQSHCQRFLPSQISETPRIGLGPTQYLSPGFVELSYLLEIIATTWCQEFRLC